MNSCMCGRILALIVVGAHGTVHPALEGHARALSQLAATGRPEHAVSGRARLWADLQRTARHRGSAAAAVDGSCGAGAPPSHSPPVHIQRRMLSAASHAPTPPPGGVIDPQAYGADPTGRRDSSAAFAAAVADLLSLGTSRSRSTLSSNITDLGGAVLDLGGGEYLVSAPIVIPAFFGNFRLSGGTLRAHPTAFPRAAYLLQIGESSCHPDYALSCNEFIGITNVLLDAAHVSAGGMLITRSMGVSVGPGVYVERFEDVGINIDQGHETLIHEAWLVGTYWNNEPPTPLAGSPALQRCDGGAAQRWTITAPRGGAAAGSPLPGSIVSQQSQQCADVDGCGAPSAGTPLLMWDCNDAFPGNNCNSTNQVWTWDRTAGQLATTMAAASGGTKLCAQAGGGGTVVLQPCDSSSVAQQWVLGADSTLTNAKYAGQCLATPAAAPAAGAKPPSLSNHSIAIQINGNDHYVIDSKLVAACCTLPASRANAAAPISTSFISDYLAVHSPRGADQRCCEFVDGGACVGLGHLEIHLPDRH